MISNTNANYANMLWENLKRLLNTLVYVVTDIQILISKITTTLAFIKEKELKNLLRLRFGQEKLYKLVVLIEEDEQQNKL
jgi:hypothetical protein